MGLFGGPSCPLEKLHIVVYGIHSPRKWKKEDCFLCEYVQAGKCNYKQIVSQHEQLTKRGYPALVKRSLMERPVAEREKPEKEAAGKAGFNPSELTDYWKVSQDYDRQWEDSTPEMRQEILDSLEQWKVNLEKGYAPLQARQKVQEWIQERAKFRQEQH